MSTHIIRAPRRQPRGRGASGTQDCPDRQAKDRRTDNREDDESRTRKVGLGKDQRRGEEPRPKKSVREQKADQEKPLIRPAPVPAPKAKKRPAESAPVEAEVTLLEADYHHSTRVIFPAPTKDIKLTDQTVEVRAVLNATIELIKRNCLFVDAYPVIKSRQGVAQSAMLKVARLLPEAVHIVARLKSDPRMSRWLCNIPLDRLSTIRSEAKKYAVAIVPGLYSFAELNSVDTKVFVQNLVLDHKYIFPNHPITKQPDFQQPGRHPAIVKLIRDEWFSGSFATRYAKYFKATRPRAPDEREMPEPILALAANAILGALSEYLLTGVRQPIKFTESAFEDSYRYHLRTLAKTRADAPIASAKLFHAIYKDVTCCGGGQYIENPYHAR
ncbi:hypothetical protein C8R46DRAFT_1027747 [Mycena filopes]|nr:hypothetical protein C8R46DRAFT_1027747 [Mycena filopes]